MDRIEREKRTVRVMIEMWCFRHEGNTQLCEECSQLLDYALQRLEHCPFGNEKTSCQNCKVHCYSPQMKSRIRQVMRWSGPRMPLHHPLMALRHILSR